MTSMPQPSQTQTVNIVLLGERRDEVPAHGAIERALPLAASALGIQVNWTWLRTDSFGRDAVATLAPYSGLWCVPASPYASMDGALAAIRVARESGMPFMGTCGGFQHAAIEYARNVLGLHHAEHAETAPEAETQVISLLACALVEQAGAIRLETDTRIRAAYGRELIDERYRCSYGFNPRFEPLFDNGDMRISGRDMTGEVRAIELRSHPFFVATLFQHERRALHGEIPPLVRPFLEAALRFRPTHR